MRWLALKMIKVYQHTLSFDHGPLKVFYPQGFCKFHPSCSQYTYQAIEKYGTLKGSYMGFRRIMRCNPWNEGGFDPVK